MSFHDVQFPLDIAYGSLGGPGGHSHVIITDSGVDEVVGRWSRKRRTWDVAYGLRSNTQLNTLQKFYIANGGLDSSWRFRAPHDFSTNANATADHYQTSTVTMPVTNLDALLGVGDGVEVDFQLRKAYVYGAYTGYIPITKPVSGTTVVSLNDVSQGSGWTVNLTTGIVTFTSPPGIGVNVKAGCEFDVEARFGEDLDQQLPIQADSFSSGSVRSIPVIEVVDGATIDEDWLPRGGGRAAFNANITLVGAQGHVFELVPASAGLTVTIEDASTMETGGDHYVFFNAGVDAVTIKGGSTTIVALAAAADCRIINYMVGSTKTWKALA